MAGNDMFEQMGSYALELARRGYAAITWVIRAPQFGYSYGNF